MNYTHNIGLFKITSFLFIPQKKREISCYKNKKAEDSLFCFLVAEA